MTTDPTTSPAAEPAAKPAGEPQAPRPPVGGPPAGEPPAGGPPTGGPPAGGPPAPRPPAQRPAARPAARPAGANVPPPGGPAGSLARPTATALAVGPPFGPASVPPPLWRRWPGPVGGAGRGVLAAVAAASAVAAVSIPLDRPGLGWLIAVVAGTAALITAAAPGAVRAPHSGTRAPATTPGTDTTAPQSGPGTTALPATATTAPTTTATAAPSTTATTPPKTTAAAAPSTTAAAAPTTTTSTTAASGATGTPEAAAGDLDPGWLRLGLDRVGWTAATVALLGVGTVRAAGWLFVLCLLTAGMTACLAVAGGRSVRGLLLSALIPPAAVFRSLPWAAAGLSRRTSAGSGSPVGRTIVSVAVSAGLLLVFGLLFSSADAAFASALGGILPDLSAATVFRWVFLFVVVGAGLLGAAYVFAAPPDLTGLDGRSSRRVRRAEWAVPLTLLNAMFAGFVLVQITVLFGGADHVLESSGLTYAEYARGGFWQLLAVTALTILVIAAVGRWAPRDTRTDRMLLRILLGSLTLLSLVVVSSALYRMNVYTDAYGATRLRLVVAACEIWLGLIFVMIAVAGVRLRADWLPRLVLGTAVLALLSLAAVNPDRLIADRNIDRYAGTGRIDVWYLSGLSADAVPALDRLPDHLRDCALFPIAERLGPDDWRGTNLGRIQARSVLDERLVPRDGRETGTRDSGTNRWGVPSSCVLGG